jgi:hypothetical protein
MTAERECTTATERFCPVEHSQGRTGQEGEEGKEGTGPSDGLWETPQEGGSWTLKLLSAGTCQNYGIPP